MIHIGKKIKEVFDSQPKNCTVKWFAQELHCERANIYRIFKKQNLDVLLLCRISVILNHDFFLDISRSLDVNSDELFFPDDDSGD